MSYETTVYRSQDNADMNFKKQGCTDWTGSRIWPVVRYRIIGVETSGSIVWWQTHPTEKRHIFCDV